ncbi:MAG: YggS family pyridoxal phosphate-dependent enzyme, partial [Candidatus Methanofastidiosa archaeon]|nr:YggS family pyridoxal phosphate-dependent enzyme [Candidatus Methanofastidiosa archaeon]
MSIDSNVRELLSSIPRNVAIEAAAKTRALEEVLEAIRAGIGIIGENYLQEAEELIPLIDERVRWHFIGTLQGGKIRRIVSLFDMIETVGSLKHAELIDK